MTEPNPIGFIHHLEPATQSGAPALLLLHGSGGDEHSLLGMGRAIAPGAALLSPRGKVLDHGAARFYARLKKKSDSDAELQARSAELGAFLQTAIQNFGLSQPLLLVGFSNGANMSLQLLLDFPQRFAGAILMRGMASERSVQRDVLPSIPVLLLGGLSDPIVQTDQTEDLANQLRSTGALVTLHWEEAGHNLCQGDVLMAFDWIRRFYSAPRASGSTK